MSYTTPPTAVTGTVVTVAYTNTFADNDAWFNGLLPAPAGASRIPISTSTSAASWGFADTAQIADGAVGGAILADGAATAAKIGTGEIAVAALDASVTALLVASGLVAFVRTAAEIASGWARETNLDGRMPVGAGTTFSVTYSENTNYGSSWSHDHTVSLTSGVENATATLATGTDTEAGHQNHTHTISGTLAALAWAIPSRAYVFCKKS